MCYERRRAEACVDESAHHALFITAVPITKMQGESGNVCVLFGINVWESRFVFFTAVQSTRPGHGLPDLLSIFHPLPTAPALEPRPKPAPDVAEACTMRGRTS